MSRRDELEPDVLKVATMDDMARALRELVRIEKAKNGRGRTWKKTYNLFPGSLYPISPPYPFITVQVANDGPEDVFYSVNDEDTQTEASIKPGETLPINFVFPTITKLVLWCRVATTVRVFGTY